MRSAVELEASTEKHNITPGPIATARELLGDMLMETGLAPAAVEAYEASLGVAPNRFKALYGVAKAAERSGDRAKAKAYYAKLLDTAKAADTQRPELVEAKAFK
jgi:tetratricopeptide (TPR) repeat protein